jgi:uncharacterized membrane protein YqaE (UPF0057 family)
MQGTQSILNLSLSFLLFLPGAVMRGEPPDKD